MAVEGHISTGDTIAGYEIEELVGRGGMGEIYRARDPRLERRVALKLLAARYSEDDSFRERLLRESRIAASLDHPNVIPVYEAGETDDRLFIAMANPREKKVIDELEFVTGKKVYPYVALEGALLRVIESAYTRKARGEGHYIGPRCPPSCCSAP